MTQFSPEYLAQIEHGDMLLSDCYEALNDVDKLLEQELTPDKAVDVIMALGEAAIAVRACSNFGVIMPHDLDEVSERLVSVTIRANYAAARIA